MNDRDQIITNNPSETQHFAEDLAKQIRGGTILALHGDLGSGKTTFTQGLARGLGVAGKIISPTFVIVRSYVTSNKKHVTDYNRFYHIDLYRIEDERGLKGLGLEEILNDPVSIVVIEWAERMGPTLPEKRIDIRFEYIDEQRRKIILNKLT